MEIIGKENGILLKTELGTVRGNEQNGCYEFLGIPYARAARYEYAVPVDKWSGTLDATRMGKACPQMRSWVPHLENPHRMFYHREFREGLEFEYSEDCLNLNIFTPIDASECPVIVFIHGGGFDSGSNAEEPFRGYALAKRGIVTVFINYRVGVFGYFAHEEIEKKYGREGNFGLDDQLTAVKWVRRHISGFGGDPDNITLLGQSAGAISIQYMCLNKDNAGLFRRAAMMSGAGLFPKFSLPKPAADTREYWQQFIEHTGCRTFEEFRALEPEKVIRALDVFKQGRKDNIYNTMPVVDGVLIKAPIDTIISDPLRIDYLIGYTTNDMYAPIMAKIGNDFGRANGAYIYYFDLDAPGDSNGAFHSSDLRYVFGRLDQSWRPYGKRDREVSEAMMDYMASFAKTGDPNSGNKNLLKWEKTSRSQHRVMCFRKNRSCMGRASLLKLTYNMITKGDPKS
ncbi:MAG: carboxylesterase/lipase family protein [Oscillospiraceae bacterium]|nr:carboxylesterase/lipase family protein [Oscillospiraceae bacterium]